MCFDNFKMFVAIITNYHPIIPASHHSQESFFFKKIKTENEIKAYNTTDQKVKQKQLNRFIETDTI